jgi:hypothetical protein
MHGYVVAAAVNRVGPEAVQNRVLGKAQVLKGLGGGRPKVGVNTQTEM